MCGIAGIHRRVDSPEGDLAKMSQALLRGIEVRGRDATGVLCQFDDGDEWLRRDTVAAKKFIRKGRTYARNARTTLLHTRFATKGSPWDVRNAHPLTDEVGKIHVIHNGVLWNDDEVFLTFGFDRVTDTDTEAIPALIEEAGWDDAGDALALIEGTLAIAAVDSRRPGELLLAKDGSPLYYAITRDLVVWASSEHAIVSGFKAAGLAPPSQKSILELPDNHLIRVNGKVGEPERYQEDTGYSWGGKTYVSYSWDWDDDDYDEHWDEKNRCWVKTYNPKREPCECGYFDKSYKHACIKTGMDEQSKRIFQKSLPPGETPKAGKNRIADDPFPAQHSVYEDIAIDVLIAQGWSTDDAIDEVMEKGWEVAGLTLTELQAADEGWYDDAIDELITSEEDRLIREGVLEVRDGQLLECVTGDLVRDLDTGDWQPEPHGGLVAPRGLITQIGDVAMAALRRKEKEKAGLDSEYLSSIDR